MKLYDYMGFHGPGDLRIRLCVQHKIEEIFQEHNMQNELALIEHLVSEMTNRQLIVEEAYEEELGKKPPPEGEGV